MLAFLAFRTPSLEDLMGSVGISVMSLTEWPLLRKFSATVCCGFGDIKWVVNVKKQDLPGKKLLLMTTCSKVNWRGLLIWLYFLKPHHSNRWKVIGAKIWSIPFNSCNTHNFLSEARLISYRWKSKNRLYAPLSYYFQLSGS